MLVLQWIFSLAQTSHENEWPNELSVILPLVDRWEIVEFKPWHLHLIESNQWYSKVYLSLLARHLALLGQGKVEWVQCQSNGISSHTSDSLISQCSSTIKLTLVCTVTSRYHSCYDLRCCQGLRLQQPPNPPRSPVAMYIMYMSIYNGCIPCLIGISKRGRWEHGNEVARQRSTLGSRKGHRHTRYLACPWRFIVCLSPPTFAVPSAGAEYKYSTTWHHVTTTWPRPTSLPPPRDHVPATKRWRAAGWLHQRLPRTNRP